MLTVTPQRVQSEIASVCALTQFNELMRTHVIDEPDLSASATQLGAISYVESRKFITDPVHWRVFSHCASVTRIYAAYESYVFELLSEWLRLVPTLYSSYAQLPDSLLKQHRVGVGVLLQRFGNGFRSEELTELRIVQPLFAGLSGTGAFGLTSEAFFIDLRNLRHDQLCALFGRVSLDNLSGWLDRHEELRSMCDAAGTTVASRLKELIDFRNDAAHARQQIDETLGVSALSEIAEFVGLLCAALHQFVMVRYIDTLQEVGSLETIGTVTEYFERPDATVVTLSANATLRVGDSVIVRKRMNWIPSTILTLQDHGEPVEIIVGRKGAELGVRFDPSIALPGSRVVRVRFERGLDQSASQANGVDGDVSRMTQEAVKTSPSATVLESSSGHQTPQTLSTILMRCLADLGHWLATQLRSQRGPG